MTLRTIVSLFLTAVATVGHAQLPSDFRVEKIDRQVREFRLDTIDLSSPTDYYLSRAQVRLSGKFKAWAPISTSMFDYSADVPDEVVDDRLRDYILGERIDYIVTYRDSVASVVTHNDGEDFVLLNYTWLENGRWVNRGQGLADDWADAQMKLSRQLPRTLYDMPRLAIINDLPTDVTPFLAYISDITLSPEDFLLEALGTRKVVINGELHRRKASWDMLKRLVSKPEFPETTGCVFMELPSWHQSTMDEFMKSDTLASGLVLRIFRDEQLNGWWDRGEYEFLCKLWEINRSLPDDKKIRVVLADYQVPYSRITTKEEPSEDRNTHMAEVVVNTVRNSSDPRNNLFLVGCGHAYKSRQAGFASAVQGETPAMTAGAQITEALGEDQVFTVFQHMMSGDNSGRNKSPIRGGIFDTAFALNGNRPIGFRLAGSPFGRQPFDGIHEIKYKTDTGTYQDNYDGYLFLGPLDDEPRAEPLTEIFTDEFVAEMQRRAAVYGYEDLRHIWFGRRAPDLTKEHILQTLLQN